MFKKTEENTFFSISLSIIKIAYLNRQIVILTIVVMFLSKIVCQYLLDLSYCIDKFQRSFGKDLLPQFPLFLLEPQEAKSDLPMTN